MAMNSSVVIAYHEETFPDLGCDHTESKKQTVTNYRTMASMYRLPFSIDDIVET